MVLVGLGLEASAGVDGPGPPTIPRAEPFGQNQALRNGGAHGSAGSDDGSLAAGRV